MPLTSMNLIMDETGSRLQRLSDSLLLSQSICAIAVLTSTEAEWRGWRWRAVCCRYWTSSNREHAVTQSRQGSLTLSSAMVINDTLRFGRVYSWIQSMHRIRSPKQRIQCDWLYYKKESVNKIRSCVPSRLVIPKRKFILSSTLTFRFLVAHA